MPEEAFGSAAPPAAPAAKPVAAVAAKSVASAPVAAPAPMPSAHVARAPVAHQKRFIVDEEREAYVTVGSSTVVFRPRQVLSGHLLQLAKDHGILTREI
jgi:hypothetical protein